MSSEEIIELGDASGSGNMVAAAQDVQKEIGESKERNVGLLSGMGGLFDENTALNDFILIAAVMVLMWIFMKSF